MGGARHHPVDDALVDHHRAEVADVAHRVAGLVERDALGGRAAPGSARRSPRTSGDVAGSTIGTSSELQAELGDPLPHGRLGTEQGEFADLAPRQPVGRLEHPVIGAFRQHDVGGGLLGPLDQLVLEHHRRDHRRAGELDALRQAGRVDVGLEQAERGLDLALVAGCDRPLDPGRRRRRVERVAADGEHRQRLAAVGEARRSARRRARPVAARRSARRRRRSARRPSGG